MPLTQPVHGLDGVDMQDIFISKGTPIVVAIRSCNRNKALWGDHAAEWKPDRWLSPLPEAVIEARIPGVYANL